jgi:hypothetical protein
MRPGWRGVPPSGPNSRMTTSISAAGGDGRHRSRGKRSLPNPRLVALINRSCAYLATPGRLVRFGRADTLRSRRGAGTGSIATNLGRLLCRCARRLSLGRGHRQRTVRAFPGGDSFDYSQVPFSARPSSGIVGFHAGYNYVSGNWLIGGETAWSWGRGKSSSGESFSSRSLIASPPLAIRSS